MRTSTASTGTHGRGRSTGIGTAYGALLYVVNFLVISPLLSPIFGNANQPFEFVVHVVFGTLLAFAFYDRSAVSAGLRRQTA